MVAGGRKGALGARHARPVDATRPAAATSTLRPDGAAPAPGRLRPWPRRCRSNFLVLRSFLASRGVRNFASFSYPPRIDYQRLVPRLARRIEGVCRDTGAPRVDVVGHSLGGLVERHLVELGDGSRVRRLVTLGSPYYSERRPARELAIFATHDPLVPPPADGRGRVVVVGDCGPLGLLQHPAVLHAVARFLRMRVASGAPEVGAAA